MENPSETFANTWLEFRVAWESQGLNLDSLVDDEEIAKTVCSLDAASQYEITECLTALAKKPRALTDLSRILERGSSFTAEDSIEAVSCYPSLCIVLRQDERTENSSRRQPNTTTQGKCEMAQSREDNEYGTRERLISDHEATIMEPGSTISGGRLLITNYSLASLGLSVRTSNALQRNGIACLADLARYDLERLHSLKNLGSVSINEVTDCLKQFDLALPFPLDCIDTSEDESKIATPSPLQLDIDTIRDWVAWSGLRIGTTLGDFLRLEDDELPCDVRSARQDLISTTLNIESYKKVDKCVLLDDLRSYLDSRLLAILDRRRWSLQPNTLQEIGDELSISREGVRQLQEKGIKEVHKYIRNNTQLRWFLHEVRYRAGLLTTRDEIENILMEYGVEPNSMQWRMLLDLSGPYKIVHESFVELAGSGHLSKLIHEISQSVDTNGQLAHEDLSQIVASSGLQEDCITSHLCERIAGLRKIGNIWCIWKGSIMDKAFVVLKAEARPMTADEINAGIGEGHSQRTLTNGMSTDRRFVRSTKTKWSLSEWGHEEYTGIWDELCRRIDASGGRTSIQSLVEDLVGTCGVTENSVRAYLATPAFLVEGDHVRRRLDFSSLVFESSLRMASGTYQFGSIVRYEVEITANILRGSGQAIPVGTAIALGVTPGTKRTFISGNGTKLYVGWREWSTSGPDIGSMRLFAEAVNACEGDHIIISFHTEEQTLEVQHEGRNPEPTTVLRMLVDTDTDHDYIALIAQAIEVKRSEVKSALRERGDERVASMLPAIESGGVDLVVAIEDLVEELL
ncbi:DNA-directed RNA polymerase subunit alpha C-terminal domain-containing protein [Vulcanococcus limneticus]|uniref:DNA-directed RNA polymerase subunit alpha C-terminal domain-containing protein n=1 Tax=Vulcanococcus limneticus TaxID=2170428 RepID=UPI00398BE8D4